MKRRRAMRLGAAAAALLPLLAGCATPSWLCVAPPGPNRVTLVASSDANDASAVAVDIVFVTDPLAAQQLAALTAAQYFARKQQLLRDFAGGLRITSWELAPGQIVRDAPTAAGCNRAQTMLFARYQSDGPHRQSLGGASAITVSLAAQDFTVTP